MDLKCFIRLRWVYLNLSSKEQYKQTDEMYLVTDWDYSVILVDKILEAD